MKKSNSYKKIFSSENAPAGKIITAAFIAGGLYVAYKNYKNPAFWAGVGALYLVRMTMMIELPKKA